MVIVLTILPNVMSPTKAFGGIRLSDIWSDSYSKNNYTKFFSALECLQFVHIQNVHVHVHAYVGRVFFTWLHTVAMVRVHPMDLISRVYRLHQLANVHVQ